MTVDRTTLLLDRVERLLRETQVDKRDILTALEYGKRALLKTEALATAVSNKDLTNVTAANVFNLYNFAQVEATLKELRNLMNADTEIVFDSADIDYFISLVERQMKASIGNVVKASLDSAVTTEVKKSIQSNKADLKELKTKIDELASIKQENGGDSHNLLLIGSVVSMILTWLSISFYLVVGIKLLVFISLGCIAAMSILLVILIKESLR